MAAAKPILEAVVLGLQFCLGFWQIGKLTPVAGLLRATVAWLLSFLPFELGNCLSRDYGQLKGLHGRVFKYVCCFVTMPVDQTNLQNRVPWDRNEERIDWRYLGVNHTLERSRDNGRNMLLVDGEMKYSITDRIWSSLEQVKRYSNNYGVFLKGYKEFWDGVAMGGILSFLELLDCVILENQTIRRTHNNWLLPVNPSVSEEKLLKALNLVGLFLQIRNVHWLIPTLISLAAAVLEFWTPLRVWIYGGINLIFCETMHFLFDRLPSVSMRRQVYSLGSWVEKLKPSNDIQYRVVKGNIRALIGGGAKISQEGVTPVQFGDDVFHFRLEGNDLTKVFECDAVTTFKCTFSRLESSCHIQMSVFTDDRRRYLASDLLTTLRCGRDEFTNVVGFVSRMANNKSGSMKYCENNRVHVRGFEESVMCYAKSGYPPLYELQLNNVVVE